VGWNEVVRAASAWSCDSVDVEHEEEHVGSHKILKCCSCIIRSSSCMLMMTAVIRAMNLGSPESVLEGYSLCGSAQCTACRCHEERGVSRARLARRRLQAVAWVSKASKLPCQKAES